MILADSFVQSARARENEFATNDIDKPLIVQFAANNPDDFADASELVSPYVYPLFNLRDSRMSKYSNFFNFLNSSNFFINTFFSVFNF